MFVAGGTGALDACLVRFLAGGWAPDHPPASPGATCADRRASVPRECGVPPLGNRPSTTPAKHGSGSPAHGSASP